MSSLAATIAEGSFLGARPAAFTTVKSPGTTLSPLRHTSDRSPRDIFRAPPSSNHVTISVQSIEPTWLSNVAPVARLTMSMEIFSAPWSSPSYSNSSFPVIAGNDACTSVTRGTTRFSLLTMPRRSALEMTASTRLMGSRWLTPERRSTRLSARASNATRSINSRMNWGMSSCRPSRSVQASCRVIFMPSSSVVG